MPADPPRLVVVTPTRGLIHSRTVESVLGALEVAERAGVVRRVDGQWWQWAHGRPIPAAHEEATERALATGAEWLWFIEDDNVAPVDSLLESARVLAAAPPEVGVVPVAYPIGTRGTRWNSIYREHGEVLFCGFGTTLIRRTVFERLAKPWFDMSRHYGRVDDGAGGTTLGLIDRPWPKNRGGVDVAFHIRVRLEAGFRIEPVPEGRMIGGHLRVAAMGASSGSGDNDHPHVMEEWNTIDADQRIFVAEDRSRFYSAALHRQWVDGFNRLGPWHTRFWLADFEMGGTYDAVHDPRIIEFGRRFPAPGRVLELGSFEGGHTVALSRIAATVTGLEGRSENINRARWIIEQHQVSNARVWEADLETARLADFGEFDVVANIGVLYHMTEPAKLLARCAEVAPAMFLWTHTATGEGPERHHEEGPAAPHTRAGMRDHSVWMPRAELLETLGGLYADVEVIGAEENHQGAGPAVTVVCRGAR